MNVKDELPNSLWWMKNQPTPVENPPDLMATTDRLTKLIFDDKRDDLLAVYGNCYVNPRNSTLFLVLTRCDPETTAMFNAALNPPPSVHIVYRTGPATYVELEGYMNSISSVAFSLPRDVVEVNCMGITENATLLIGIGNVTPKAVETLANAIHGLAPEELIFIRKSGAVVTLAQPELVKIGETNTTETIVPIEFGSPVPVVDNRAKLFLGLSIIAIVVLFLLLFSTVKRIYFH